MDYGSAAAQIRKAFAPRVGVTRNAVRDMREKIVRANPPALVVGKTYLNTDTGSPECALWRLKERLPADALAGLTHDLEKHFGDDFQVYEESLVIYARVKMFDAPGASEGTRPRV